MGILFEIAVLLLLAFIVIELYAIRSELLRVPSLVRRTEDAKESPTINVNVGTLPVPPAKDGEAAQTAPVPSVAPPPASEEEEAVEGAGEAEGEEPESRAEAEAEPPRRLETPALRTGAASATPSGLLAVKCQKCQAENSSYRSECFNCGASLR